MLRLRGAAEPALFELPAPESLVGERAGGDVRLYRGWLSKDAADALLDEIRANTTWVQERRKMYDRFVDVPRVPVADIAGQWCAAGTRWPETILAALWP